MVKYKQWKMLNENFASTFGTVLTQPNVVGGVVGSTGASNWSLEETKARIRKYMLGEDDESGEGDSEPKPKKKPAPDKPSKSFGPPSDDNDSDDDDDAGFGDGDDDDDDMGGDDLGGDDSMGGDDLGDDDMDGDDDGFGSKSAFGKKGSPFGGDDMGGDDDLGDDEGGMDGDDDMSGDDLGGDDFGDDGMGGDDSMGLGDDQGMGGMGGDMGMGGFGASAKGHVCDKCGHHEPDKNAKFCKMCGKCCSKFMKKFMSADTGSKVKGKVVPWLDKGADNGEVKKGGKQTAKDMFPTVKGGKKDPGRDPNKAGGKVPATKIKKEHKICSTCGALACEVHGLPSPSATRLDKAFFKSLTGQIGRRGGKFDDGIHDNVVEDALYTPPTEEETRDPKPGEPGFAPNGRVGGIR